MMASNIVLNHAGIAKVLKENMRGLVQATAEQIADNVRAQGITVGDVDGGASEYDLPVTVRSYTTDRAVSAVVIAHPAGLAVEAKHGSLTKAAASVGLQVKSKP